MLGTQQFMELMDGGDNNMIGQQLPIDNDEIAGGNTQTMMNGDDSEIPNQQILQVFNIYSSSENFAKSGIFNGGLDVGIDPMRLSVDFNIKE